jgi:parallel beta-helix repeat protein
MTTFPKFRPLHAVALLGGGGLAAGMLLAAPGAASAATLSCGSTITASLTLTANLNCSHDTTSDAITIGAAGVTVDLNGYKILGPGDSADTDAIADFVYSDVTVENGTISNFQTDIALAGYGGGDLTGVDVQDIATTDNTIGSSTAVEGEYLDGASITGLSLADPDIGVDLYDNEDTTVSDNTLTSPYLGLNDLDGTGDILSDNTVTNAVDAGIEAYNATGEMIESNTVTGGHSATGVSDEDSQDATITGNKLSGLYEGVYEYSSTGATISDNTGTGDGWGVYSFDCDDLTLTSNKFTDGQFGIETDEPLSETLNQNTTNDNSEAGVYVNSDGDTGLSVTLTGNTGNYNRFGLYSQITTSGSGNHAKGNKVVNCHDVTCGTKSTRSAAAPPHHPPAIPVPGAAARR